MTRRSVSLSDGARRLLAAAAAIDIDAYLVGGSLRDAILQGPIADLDLAVANAPAFAQALADELGGTCVTLDGERGISRIMLDRDDVRTIDVAALRGDIIADLARRDFTIDALAASCAQLATEAEIDIIDPHGGLDDLAARTVRLISQQALRDDPLRLLRAVRLAVQLEFTVDAATEAAIRREAPAIARAAAERQRDELSRCFATDRAAEAVRLLDRLGLLELLLPEVTAGRGVEQPKEHAYDVFDHGVEAVAALDFLLAGRAPKDARERDFWRAFWEQLDEIDGLRSHLATEVAEGRTHATLLKLATLLHDVAKPETRGPDETGRIRFLGHAERGAEIAREIMHRLRFSNREAHLVATMVDEHLRPTQLGHDELPSRRALYRFYRDTGEAAEDVLLLSLVDAYSARGPAMTLDAWRGYVAYIAHVLSRRDEEAALVHAPRLVTGEDVMSALGIGPGPEVGRLLAALEEAQAAGEVGDRDDALALARRLHKGAKPQPAGVTR